MSFWTSRSAKNSAKSSLGGALRPFRRQDCLLVSRIYDETRLPVSQMRTHRLRTNLVSNLAKCKDVEIVTEFRSKMRAAEEMISKLAFSLKEIQGMRKMAAPENPQNASHFNSTSTSTSKFSRICQFVKPVELVGK